MARSAPDALELPAPRYATAWAALVYALCTLALAYPILLGKFLVNPHSDEYKAGFAFRDFGAEGLRQHGAIPLWNPYQYGGLPFVGAMHGDIFYAPSMLLRAMAPTDVAMSLTFALHVFLSGLFAYLFLRASRVVFGGSLVGGVAYMLSGAVAGLAYPGHDGKLYVCALLPLSLLLLLRGIRDGALWVWGVLAIVVGLAVLSPHPQSLQYMLLVDGAFALFAAFGRPDGVTKLPRDVALRRLGLAFGAVLLGAAIGTIQYLPVKEYTPWSPRAGGMGWEHAISYAMPPEELVNAYLPEFSGLLTAYWGRNGIHLHSDYVGVVALILATLGVFHQRLRQFRLFWIGTAIVALLWSMGGSTPFFYFVYHLVPGTKYFRAPSIMLYVFGFASSVLAALGAERVLAGQVSRRALYVWGGVAAFVTLLALSGVLTSISTSLAPEQRYDVALANRPALMIGALRSLVFVLVTLGLIYARERDRMSARAVAWSLAAATALDLWIVERHYWAFSEPAKVIYASNAAFDYVRKQPQPGRVLSVPLAQYDGSWPGEDADFTASGLMSHDIRQVRGYQGNAIRYYQDLIAEEDPNQQLSVLASERFWQLGNVNYFLTNVPQAPLPTLTLAVGPVKDAVGNTAYLYRTNAYNPYAWVTPARLKAPGDRVFATLYEQRLPHVVRQVAMFDTSATTVDAPTDLRTLPDTLAIATTVTSYAPGHVTLELSAPAPAGAALVASENYYPGWTATVDGKPAPIGRADYSLIGVGLPAGARRVELTFASPTYERGKTITLVAAGLSLLLIAAGALREKSRRA